MFSLCNTVTSLPNSSLTGWKISQIEMFPVGINKNQSTKNVNDTSKKITSAHVERTHTLRTHNNLPILSLPSCCTLLHFLAHLLPPSCLYLTKQMEVSVDFHLSTNQGGAAELICMFRSEELSVWVTLLTQLRGPSAQRGEGQVSGDRGRGSVLLFYYCNLWMHLLSLVLSSKAVKNKALLKEAVHTKNKKVLAPLLQNGTKNRL